MQPHTRNSLCTAEQTARLATLLGPRLVPGDVVLLNGPVGAGKTHFARALIKSILTHDEDVPSPTFTLVQTYDVQQGTLWHADLYRLSSTFEVEELGLNEAFEDAICLVEWPDRLGSTAPDDAVSVDISITSNEESRALKAQWTDPKWDSKIKGLFA